MTILQRGCIKSIQLIDKWVKPITINGITTLQVDVNQVDPTKSIVLFNGFRLNAGADPSKYDDVTCTDAKNTTFELHAIEILCVKFTMADKRNASDYYHVVFQLVEFY